jgi:dynein heavy chain
MVVVNFRPELPQLMLEARYLDRKGFEVPPLALQVALQEEEYRQWQELLAGLIRQYYQVAG